MQAEQLIRMLDVSDGNVRQSNNSNWILNYGWKMLIHSSLNPSASERMSVIDRSCAQTNVVPVDDAIESSDAANELRQLLRATANRPPPLDDD